MARRRTLHQTVAHKNKNRRLSGLLSAKTPSGGFQCNVRLLHSDRPVTPASVFSSTLTVLVHRSKVMLRKCVSVVIRELIPPHRFPVIVGNTLIVLAHESKLVAPGTHWQANRSSMKPFAIVLMQQSGRLQNDG
jgi:hypothetical protein